VRASRCGVGDADEAAHAPHRQLQKRHDFNAKKIDQSHSALKEHVISWGGGAGGGFSLTVLLLSHVPWVLYVIYQSSKGSKKGGILPGGKYAYD
jgi:hypothetical protein